MADARWVPEERWLRRWTWKAWEVAFDGLTLEIAQDRGIHLRVDAHRFAELEPETLFVDRSRFGYIAAAIGCHVPYWARHNRIGVQWCLDHLTDPQHVWPWSEAGWLAVVTHEVAHHLSPPREMSGRAGKLFGRWDKHGADFKAAHELVAERLFEFGDELDAIVPKKPRESFHAHDRRVEKAIELMLATDARRAAACRP